MTNAPDFTKLFQDMLSNFPVDSTAVQTALRSQAAFGQKLSRVALDAAEKSTELSANWARDTFARLGEVTSSKTDPADLGKAMSDYASKSAELAAENLAAFAEIAKKLQSETVEIMLAAGKEASEKATSAVKDAGENLQSTVRKAAK